MPESIDIPVMGIAPTLRNQAFEPFPNHLFPRASEHLLGGGVEYDDTL
jgi:hypothetical protein